MATATGRTRSSSSPTRKPRKAAPRKPKLTAADLKISPEVAWYLESRGIPLPDCPPKIKTPEPRKVRGSVFDPDRVDRVLAVFKALRHVSGKWAGRPLNPDPWQIAYIIAPVFGWVKYDKEAGSYVRIIRDLYVDVPRKNGKSTLAAGIAIYMACADGEMGAQVVTAATSEKQAGYVFNPIKTLAEHTPLLKGLLLPFTKKIIHPSSNSYIEVVSAVADAQHGANIHCSIVDELHVHKSGDMLKVLETGRGSRTQPLSVIITTADSGKPDTAYDNRRRRIEQEARGVIKSGQSYGVVWAADEGDDPFAVETQKKANPGYGVSPSASYLAGEATNAKNSPADLADYLRLHLGIRTKQNTRYINLPDWDANIGMVDEEALRGAVAYGGLDLGSVSDLTALCWLFPDGADQYKAVWRFWMPEAAFDDLNLRTSGSAEVWKREGWLKLTPGNVTDYDYIRATVKEDGAKFKVQSIGYDRWNSSQIATDLQNDGVEMIRVGQGYASMSAPMKEIQRLVLKGAGEKKPVFNHGGNPIMRWMTDNLAVSTDPAGNVKPNKAVVSDKIDGWSALANAMSESIKAQPEQESVYETQGVRAV